LRFKPDLTRRIINMDKTHHDLSLTGDKGRSCSQTCNKVLTGLSNPQDTSPVPTQRQQPEKRCLPSMFMTQVQKRKTFLESRCIGWLDFQLLVVDMGVLRIAKTVTASLLYNLTVQWRILLTKLCTLYFVYINLILVSGGTLFTGLTVASNKQMPV
jgi:hypothetical protein